tara:strand:- start:803 stop:1120 length:318 start_codon:yes stop_codon:yes gene_type:complete
MEYEKFKKEYEEYQDYESSLVFPNVGRYTAESTNDPVNSPSHYTRGKVEAIEIIEQAIEDAASVQAGFNQGQALKYLLRMWLKDNPLQDAKKAQWYLTRLIESMR